MKTFDFISGNKNQSPVVLLEGKQVQLEFTNWAVLKVTLDQPGPYVRLSIDDMMFGAEYLGELIATLQNLKKFLDETPST